MHGDNIGVSELGALPSLIDPAIEGEVYYNRAIAYQELGDTAKADADFARAKGLGYGAPRTISSTVVFTRSGRSGQASSSTLSRSSSRLSRPNYPQFVPSGG